MIHFVPPGERKDSKYLRHVKGLLGAIGRWRHGCGLESLRRDLSTRSLELLEGHAALQLGDANNRRFALPHELPLAFVS